MPRDHRREKHLRYLQTIGVAGWVPAGPVRDRIVFLHDQRGITYDVIAERTGMSRDMVIMQRHGVDKRGKEIRFCQRSTERAVLGARFGPDDGAWFLSVGVRRRLQGLAYAGYTSPFLGECLGMVDYRNLCHVLDGSRSRRMIQAGFAREVVALCDKLDGVDPVSLGVRPQSASRARTIAVKRGYVPLSCWDADTIDDPDVFPEWTGECGTVQGSRLHKKYGIPMCPACQEAFDSYGTGPIGFSPDKLRALRVKLGLSQVGLSKLIGCHPSTLAYWERGRSVPGDGTLDRLLSVLDCTVEDVTD